MLPRKRNTAIQKMVVETINFEDEKRDKQNLNNSYQNMYPSIKNRFKNFFKDEQSVVRFCKVTPGIFEILLFYARIVFFFDCLGLF